MDWIEVYTPDEQSLANWKLEVTSQDSGGPVTEEFTFPAGESETGTHHLAFFATEQRTPLHTGFKLPGSGATVRLLDASALQNLISIVSK